jgi:hypothetical protein
VIPTRFYPPCPESDTPQTLFAPGISRREILHIYEFIRRENNRTQFLIYTDGACLSNGQSSPRAGCSFVFRPCTPGVKGQISFPLELEGPLAGSTLKPAIGPSYVPFLPRCDSDGGTRRRLTSLLRLTPNMWSTVSQIG